MLFGVSGALQAKTMHVLEQGMNTASLRQNVLADNIANVDTPGFKRSMVSFESQMQRAFASERRPRLEAYRTDARHIAFHQSLDYTAVQPKLHVEYDTRFRNDGNNVDIDREMTYAAKNSLLMNAMLDAYSRNIRILDLVMQA